MAKLAINGGEKIASELEGIRWPVIGPEDEAAVKDALHKNYLGGLGDENLPIRIFEREFSKYHDTKYCLTVANGTVSLEASLKAAGIEPGDEVIVPAITFIASVTAVVSVGAVPVFADVDPETCQITAKTIEEVLSPKTRGIIVVHYCGYMTDMEAIMDTARKHGLIVVEDCAHAQGSAWKGKKAGSWGTFGSFSFQHTKTLAAGEGGAVITSDDQLYEKAVLFTNIGRKMGQTSYYHYVSTSNCRLGGLQGALLLSQFKKFPAQAEERCKNGRYLAEELNKIPGIRCLPVNKHITLRGYYFFLIDYDAKEFGCSREQFVKALKAEGVSYVSTGYERPLYREVAFSKDNLRPLLHKCIDIPDYNSLYLPNAEKWAERQVTIMHYYLVGGRRKVDLILEAIKKIRDNIDELTRI